MTRKCCTQNLSNTPKDILRAHLAQAVTLGNQNEAELILKEHPELLLSRGTILDHSGRKFTNTTVWEYTLWALDVRYMAPMMLKCLLLSKQIKNICMHLRHQFYELQNNGITYELDGKKFREKHYNFSIIEILKNYVQNFSQWNWRERALFWASQVGMAQSLFPAHVVNHWCDPDESFKPTPSFKKEKLQRSLMYYNWKTNKYEFWFSNSDTSRLGIDFAIARGQGVHATYVWLPFSNIIASIDASAMAILHKTRLEDLHLIKRQLTLLI
ncbi:hypothetical protein [Fluoribacter gormanii]|uniref:hypothetical protein n=1 Tax=Fluoribacter gormanii TaxID=464 RepID=UPI00104125E0|nr:hypothetical protein [Fluoribacter gormanii]